MKKCSGCKEHKSLDDFHVSNTFSDGRDYYCRPCRNTRNVAAAKRARGHRTRRYRENRHAKMGVTVEVYEDVRLRQGGCCAICGVHESELTRALYVDHDHETESFRGLLCSRCNTGLGMFADDTRLLQIAMLYLKECS